MEFGTQSRVCYGKEKNLDSMIAYLSFGKYMYISQAISCYCEHFENCLILPTILSEFQCALAISQISFLLHSLTAWQHPSLYHSKAQFPSIFQLSEGICPTIWSFGAQKLTKPGALITMTLELRTLFVLRGRERFIIHTQQPLLFETRGQNDKQ